MQRMPGHLINCMENQFLLPFSKVWSHLSVSGAAIEKYSIRQVSSYKCSVGKKYKLFYTYGQKTYARFIFAKLETSSEQLHKKMNFFKDVFLTFWPQLQSSYWWTLSVAASVINSLQML